MSRLILLYSHVITCCHHVMAATLHTPQLFAGKSFSSYAEASAFIAEYESRYHQKFWKRSSRKITSTPNIKRHINPELVYYEIYYSCIHGGEKFKSRSKGLRKHRTFRFGSPCGAHIRLRASPDGRTLDVRAFSDQHNHISVQDRWTVGQIEALIEEYKLYPALYDSNHQDYDNPKVRSECVEKIVRALQSDRLGVTEEEVVLQWNSLTVRYLNTRSSGNDLNEPQYWFLHKLDFLKDYLGSFDIKDEFDEAEIYEPEVSHDWEKEDPLASSERGTKSSKDDSDIFGEFVASQLKKITDDGARQDTVFEIHQVLHKALKKK